MPKAIPAVLEEAGTPSSKPPAKVIPKATAAGPSEDGAISPEQLAKCRPKAIVEDGVCAIGIAREDENIINPDPDTELRDGDEAFVVSKEPPTI